MTWSKFCTEDPQVYRHHLTKCSPPDVPCLRDLCTAGENNIWPGHSIRPLTPDPLPPPADFVKLWRYCLVFRKCRVWTPACIRPSRQLFLGFNSPFRHILACIWTQINSFYALSTALFAVILLPKNAQSEWQIMSLNKSEIKKYLVLTV